MILCDPDHFQYCFWLTHGLSFCDLSAMSKKIGIWLFRFMFVKTKTVNVKYANVKGSLYIFYLGGTMKQRVALLLRQSEGWGMHSLCSLPGCGLLLCPLSHSIETHMCVCVTSAPTPGYRAPTCRSTTRKKDLSDWWWDLPLLTLLSSSLLSSDSTSLNLISLLSSTTHLWFYKHPSFLTVALVWRPGIKWRRVFNFTLPKITLKHTWVKPK